MALKKAATQKQLQLAEQSRKSSLCARFVQTLRFANVLGALGILGVSITLVVLSCYHVADTSKACAERSTGECYRIATQAAAFIGIAFFSAGFALLTLITESSATSTSTRHIRAHCVARHFGFMVNNVWRGLFSVFCGLATAWVGRAYKEMERSAAADQAYLGLLVIGAFNFGVGLLYMLFGGCNCIASDPLHQEFADFETAHHMYRAIIVKERYVGPGAGPTQMRFPNRIVRVSTRAL